MKLNIIVLLFSVAAVLLDLAIVEPKFPTFDFLFYINFEVQPVHYIVFVLKKRLA